MSVCLCVYAAVVPHVVRSLLAPRAGAHGVRPLRAGVRTHFAPFAFSVSFPLAPQDRGEAGGEDHRQAATYNERRALANTVIRKLGRLSLVPPIGVWYDGANRVRRKGSSQALCYHRQRSPFLLTEGLTTNNRVSNPMGAETSTRRPVALM